MLFAHNLSQHLSIDETALSNGELYTILTNKEAKGRKGSIVAMVKGTQAQDIIAVLSKLPEKLRHKVKEVTMDMAANMQLAIRRCFLKAERVIDRFPGLRCPAGSKDQIPLGSHRPGKQP